MAQYNFSTLIHRPYQWSMTLPDGSIHNGISVKVIPVRIPKIQRDYAEGRDSEMIERKRRNLLNDMLDVVHGIRGGLSFDFVYGYMMSNGEIITNNGWQNQETNPAFEPLDGQQRLTTLFLLYWLFGREADICDENGHSLLVYETRDTSEEFCHWLVNQHANFIICDWEAKVSEVKKQNDKNIVKWGTLKGANGVVDPIANRLRFPLHPVPSLFQYMQSLDSFKWDWHDDPNIHSMITVLESAMSLLHERGLQYSTMVNQNKNLDNITFMLLDNLVCDGDQLFEKMNARGKALTSFEILKSSLEEEMERQNLPNSNSNLTNGWRTAMDVNWIDYCWDNSNIGNNPQLKTVMSVEEKLERLLVRMVGKSFFTTNITGTPIVQKSDAKDYTSLLIESVSKSEKVNLVVDRYLEYARHERAVNVNVPVPSPLDFQSIYDDIQNLIYQDTAQKWHDASSLLPQFNRSNTKTLMEMFLEDNPTHNIRVMVYAMFAYLRIVPASTIAVNNIEKVNFIDWMRFIRNVYNSDNKNSGLDNFGDVQTAIDAIDKWLDVYVKNYRNNNNQDVLRLILNHIKLNANSQEQARLDEEAIKADLRINGSKGISPAGWESSILTAEGNFYLWGQIIAPLSWSYNGVSYDKSLFDNYISRLNQIFTNPIGEDKPIDALLIQAMLCYQDYRHNLKSDLGSLGRLNNNRDYSWKQYLRKRDNNTGYYGSLFKVLIDRWCSPSLANLPFEDFLKYEIDTRKRNIQKTDWRFYIVNISDPKTLLGIFRDIQTYGRYLYTPNNDHSFYFRSNTFRTYYRYELLTTYLSYEKRLLQNGVKASSPANSADDYGAHVDFTLPNKDVFRLSLGNNRSYTIERLVPKGNLSLFNLDVYGVEMWLKTLGVIK